MDRQCSSCGGFCRKSGCERKNVKPEQEPVAVWELQEDGWDTIADPQWMETLPVGTKLYTAPPQREWVGLTDEELAEISEFHFHGAFSGREVYEDIETRLKEKNA